MAHDARDKRHRTTRQDGERASTPILIFDDARPPLPDLSTYPPAVRRLIAVLTEQVLRQCTIPAPESPEGRGHDGQGDAE